MRGSLQVFTGSLPCPFSCSPFSSFKDLSVALFQYSVYSFRALATICNSCVYLPVVHLLSPPLSIIHRVSLVHLALCCSLSAQWAYIYQWMSEGMKWAKGGVETWMTPESLHAGHSTEFRYRSKVVPSLPHSMGSKERAAARGRWQTALPFHLWLTLVIKTTSSTWRTPGMPRDNHKPGTTA